MGWSREPQPGEIAWADLTVPDAEGLRDFYAEVVGWRPEPVEMGSYADFNLVQPATGEPAAGLCHARGANADLPPVWLLYVVVRDLAASVERCLELGGELVAGPRALGPEARLAVIRDPAGAALALWERLSR
ncbi:MAG: VOC family protein [Thermoanaerobaculia bacterium]|nr:VOC family protein [Thermoanaerobaculia bacterium]MCZ7650271.1 VOC family protein [Thermoanaerobaculia bacterium]